MKLSENQIDGYDYIFLYLEQFDGPIIYVEDIKKRRFNVLNKEEEKDGNK